MESAIFNMDEVVSRKDYLKNKEIQKNNRKKKKPENKRKPSYILLACILILGGYVVFQFSTYTKKYRLINNVPVEISSLKDYDIYYTTKTYTYNPEIVLNYTKSNSSNKEVVSESKGITNIEGEGIYVYGIKEDKLVRIKNSGSKVAAGDNKFEEMEVVIGGGVKSYAVYNDEIYAFLKGENIETGIYAKNKADGKYNKIIGGEASQILIDEKNIFIVGVGEDREIYSYLKDGTSRQKLTNNRAVTYMIEEGSEIYFSDEKSGGKIFSVNKYSSVEKSISKDGAINIPNETNYSNGSHCMGIYDGYIYYINTSKDSKLFKSKIDGSEAETEVIAASIEKISMIGYSVIYKEKDGKAIYRYEIKNKISSELTSGRIIDFSATAGVK